jgi:hypothetical protein
MARKLGREGQDSPNGRPAKVARKPGREGQDSQNGRPARMARMAGCEGQDSRMADKTGWITLNNYRFTQVFMYTSPGAEIRIVFSFQGILMCL